MARTLPVLCPQYYDGCTMEIVPCTRCESGWNKLAGRCEIETGAERFKPVKRHRIPSCPIQNQCQHQIQAGDEPCAIRKSGQVCESALATIMPRAQAEGHPLGFNAQMV